jgi:hypothetical protein
MNYNGPITRNVVIRAYVIGGTVALEKTYFSILLRK